MAKLLRRLQNGIEHRLQFIRGATDDFQHFTGCCLVLKGFLKLSLARLLRFEQPRVLDGDHGLVGEGADQLDLLVGEGAHRATRQHKHADWCSLTQQRNAKYCTTAHDPVSRGLKFWIVEYISNLNSSPFKYDPAANSTASHFKGTGPQKAS